MGDMEKGDWYVMVESGYVFECRSAKVIQRLRYLAMQKCKEAPEFNSNLCHEISRGGLVLEYTILELVPSFEVGMDNRFVKTYRCCS